VLTVIHYLKDLQFPLQSYPGISRTSKKPSTLVYFANSSSIVLIPGALESSNQALLDDVHHGL
jgi:hypothetical protein